MEIALFVQPKFRYAFDCKKIIEGIVDESYKKRYRLFMQKNSHDKESICIIIADDRAWLDSKIKTLKVNYDKIILINNFYEDFNINYVLSDYEIAVNDLIKKSLYRIDRFALYGVKRDNYLDCNKERCFLSNHPKGRVFYNDSGFRELYREFSGHLKDFDAVICTDDIIATSLVHHLKSEHLLGEIPILSLERYKLTSFLQTPVSSIDNDLYFLGTQAVVLASFIYKSNVESSIVFKLNTCTSYDDSKKRLNVGKFESMICEKKTDDTEEGELIRIETFMRSCDTLDFDILTYVLQGNISYQNISELLFITENTLKYRIKRLKELLGVSHKSEMTALLSKYMI